MKRSWNIYNCGGDRPSTNNMLDRKTLEKNRRLHMKALYLTLFAQIPKDHLTMSCSKVRMSLLDRLDRSASYINDLRERIEVLKERKKQFSIDAEGILSNTTTDHFGSSTTINSSSMAFRLPILELRELGSTLEVILICGSKYFLFYQIIHVLEEEGAEVVSAKVSTAGDKIVVAIHCQVRCSRIGIEISSVCGRLNELVYEMNT